jgi:hypothetical protein
MTAWLDENCGADGWAMTPSGTRGVLNDAVAIYFPDPACAAAWQPSYQSPGQATIVSLSLRRSGVPSVPAATGPRATAD